MTEPIPAPEPATPTVAAPAPMNLAAESMSLLAEEVWRARAWLMANCLSAGLWARLRREQEDRDSLARDAIAREGDVTWCVLTGANSSSLMSTIEKVKLQSYTTKINI